MVWIEIIRTQLSLKRIMHAGSRLLSSIWKTRWHRRSIMRTTKPDLCPASFTGIIWRQFWSCCGRSLTRYWPDSTGMKIAAMIFPCSNRLQIRKGACEKSLIPASFRIMRTYWNGHSDIRGQMRKPLQSAGFSFPPLYWTAISSMWSKYMEKAFLTKHASAEVIFMHYISCEHIKELGRDEPKFVSP